jgi:SAM-dependent methyltransferase
VTAHDQSGKYYFDHPELWEEINLGRFGEEPEFLVEVFRRYGDVREVLDVGCGTGSHLARLRELGIAGTGIDLNPSMVEYARARHPDLSFAVGDMRELKYANAFDAVICLCTTFSYNTTNEQMVETLGGFRDALRGGGLLVVDLLNAMGFLQRRPVEPTIEATYERFGVRSVTENRIDEANQLLIEQRTFFSVGGGEELGSNTTAYRLVFPQEFRYLLETNGLELVGIFGGFDIEHTDLDQARMVAVARKR